MSFKKDKHLYYLVICSTFTWNLIGELVELWQEPFSYELILGEIGKFCQYWSSRNFKKIRWCNVFIFLLLSFILLMLIISDDTICGRWWLACLIKLWLEFFCYWSLTIYVQLYTNLRNLHFACISSEYLKTNVLLALVHFGGNWTVVIT